MDSQIEGIGLGVPVIRWGNDDIYYSFCYLEPILRLLNLQLQRQRCSRLERFSKQNEIFLFSKHAWLPAAL
jgi:hypothetical protein